MAAHIAFGTLPDQGNTREQAVRWASTPYQRLTTSFRFCPATDNFGHAIDASRVEFDAVGVSLMAF